MPDLVRHFCICGNELEDTESLCTMCGGTTIITYDAETRSPKPSKRTKAHDHDCECEQCEAMQPQLDELNFDGL